MASLSSLINSQPKEKTGRFGVIMVHYSKLIPSEANNYSTDNIEELARAILLSGGVKQNLLARKKSPDEYELIAGHRRRLAVKYLVEEMGQEEYAMMPVHVEKDGDIISEINLILANCSMRERSDWEKMMEVARLTELMKALQSGTEDEQERFRRLFGKEPSVGGRELRKMVAESLGLSETKVANLRHINSSLVPELKDRFQTGEIGVSVANEAAGLPAEEQMELAKKDRIQLVDVKSKSVSESDTDGKLSSSCLIQTGDCLQEECGGSLEAQGKEKDGEPLSAYGTPRKIYPEDSLIATAGCDRTKLKTEPREKGQQIEGEELGARAKAAKVKTYDRNILGKMIAEAENALDLMREYWIENQPREYTKQVMTLQAYKNLLMKHDSAEAEQLKNQEQPELPAMKNNNQRKAWLKNYKAWGLWYRDEHIDVNYYKYDFEDGSRLIVAEFPQREHIWTDEKYDQVYYHLIECGKRKYRSDKVYEDKYQYHSNSETELVEYLKKIQKKKG